MDASLLDTGSALDRRDALWKTLVRFDAYIATTLTRAAAIVAANALIVGVLVVKFRELIVAFEPGGHRMAAAVGLAVVAVLSLAAAVVALVAILPYLGGRQRSGSSLIFFGDVAARSSDGFSAEYDALTAEEFDADLAHQVHDMASALEKKFAHLRHASWLTVLAFIGALLLVVCFIASAA